MIVMDTPSHRRHEDRIVRTAHLISTVAGRDGRIELLRFGHRIGLRESWLQERGTPWEHFDLFAHKIEAAIDAGAIRTDRAAFVAYVHRKRVLTGEVPSNRVRRIKAVMNKRAFKAMDQMEKVPRKNA